MKNKLDKFLFALGLAASTCMLTACGGSSTASEPVTKPEVTLPPTPPEPVYQYLCFDIGGQFTLTEKWWEHIHWTIRADGQEDVYGEFDYSYKRNRVLFKYEDKHQDSVTVDIYAYDGYRMSGNYHIPTRNVLISGVNKDGYSKFEFNLGYREMSQFDTGIPKYHSSISFDECVSGD
jgi:hypothetical protein